MRLKSIQALKKAVAPVLFDTVTAREVGAPCVRLAGTVVPSSSSTPEVSSPVAVALDGSVSSGSVAAPIRRVEMTVLEALGITL